MLDILAAKVSLQRPRVVSLIGPNANCRDVRYYAALEG
jgi:hypothetical protein